jgi:hypothetical protein
VTRNGDIENLAAALADAAEDRSTYVIVIGPAATAHQLADRIAAEIGRLGRPSVRLTDRSPLADEDDWRSDPRPRAVVVADGPRWHASPPAGRWDVCVDSWGSLTVVKAGH